MLYPGHRHLQSFGDPLQCLLGKPIMFALNVKQYLNERTRFRVVLVNYLINSLFVHSLCPDPLLSPNPPSVP